MLKSKTVLILGIWLILVAFLGVGLPFFWQTALYVLTGVYLVLRFFFYAVRHQIHHSAKDSHDTFVENGDKINLPKQ